MISFCIKKRVYLVILGGVGAFLLLMYMMPAAYSSTVTGTNRARADTLSSYNSQPDGSPQLALPAQGSNALPTASAQPATPAQRNGDSPAGSPQPKIPSQGGELPPDGPLPPIGPPPPAIPSHGGIQQNNQSFHGISNSANHALLVGRNEGNSGNQGVNRGFAQDNAIDSGNQISSQHKAIGYQVNNQLVAGDGGGSNSGNSSTAIGFNQGNSGNEGINLGHNQDNAGNAGNQVNNQANVIGTQINKQGSTVNNDHNVIEHQVNYVNLLPGIGVYLSLHPKVAFAVSLGN